MTVEERAEVINIFISIGEKFLKENKHFHLEPILARDIIQAIKDLVKENAELKEQIERKEIEKAIMKGIIEQKVEQIEVKKLEILELERKLNDSNELCNQQALRIAKLEGNISFME